MLLSPSPSCADLFAPCCVLLPPGYCFTHTADFSWLCCALGLSEAMYEHSLTKVGKDVARSDPQACFQQTSSTTADQQQTRRPAAAAAAAASQQQNQQQSSKPGAALPAKAVHMRFPGRLGSLGGQRLGLVTKDKGCRSMLPPVKKQKVSARTESLLWISPPNQTLEGHDPLHSRAISGRGRCYCCCLFYWRGTAPSPTPSSLFRLGQALLSKQQAGSKELEKKVWHVLALRNLFAKTRRRPGFDPGKVLQFTTQKHKHLQSLLVQLASTPARCHKEHTCTLIEAATPPSPQTSPVSTAEINA